MKAHRAILLTARRRAQRGQVLVETMIIVPVMIFVVLGALQLALIQHGRVMTEFAAYNAARAGIVHNANWNVMQNAAMLGALPLYGRTDTVPRFLETWGRTKLQAEGTQAIDTGIGTLENLANDLLGVNIASNLAQDVSLIEVNVTSPTTADFDDAQDWQDQRALAARQIDEGGPLAYPTGEIDFDDANLLAANPQMARLGVQVRVLMPLNIPLVNKIIFEIFVLQRLMNVRRLRADLDDWSRWQAKLPDGRTVERAAAQADGEGPLDDFVTTRQWVKEIRTLRWFAAQTGVYLLPLRATYAMQMHSNVYESSTKAPVWFDIDDF